MIDIGFIGLGTMGRPMARHLQAAGHRLFLHDVVPVAPELVAAGGVVCKSAKDVAEQGDIARSLQKHLARIAHVQLADNPGRNEPGTGEINYPFLFRHLDAIGYRGWIGCEYKPRTTTVDGLGWHAALTLDT